MLDTMRRGAQGWVGKLLFGVLVIGFGFWGISGSFSNYGVGTLARVGKTEISTQEFQQSYQSQFENLRRRLGGRITAEQARAFGFDQQILSQLIGAAAIDNHTRELQLGLPDNVVTEHLKKDPRFSTPDGRFNKGALDQFLRQNGLSERGFLNIAKKDDVRDQLTIALVESVNVPAAMIEALHKYRDETRKFAFFALDPAKVPSVGEPDDAKITATYEANKRRFMSPERRTASALLLTLDAVKKTVSVTDDEIKAAYEQSPERFDVPERRHVLQISFPDKAKAEAAAKEIAGGKSFADVAKETGAKDSDIDLGTVTKRGMIDPKIADAAFALAKDAVSPVVEGRFATVLLKVTEIVAGKKKTLDEVKGELKDGIAQERAGAEIQKLHDQVDDSRSGGKTLKEIADAMKLQLVEFKDIDRSGKTVDGKPAFDSANADRLVAAVFASKVGVESEAIELGDGGAAWVDVQGITPEKQRELADVKGDAKALWIEQETRKAIVDAGNKLVERLNKGEAIETVAADAGGKVTTTDPILRNGKPVGLTEQGVNLGFALAKGAAGSTDTLDGKSRTILKVVDIIAAPPQKTEDAEKSKAELQRQMQSDVMAEYLAGLQARYGVSIDAAAFKRAIGADREQTQ